MQKRTVELVGGQQDGYRFEYDVRYSEVGHTIYIPLVGKYTISDITDGIAHARLVRDSL